MNSLLLSSATAVALAASNPAHAQHQGHDMPAPPAAPVEPSQPTAPEPQSDPHAGHDMSHGVEQPDHTGMAHSMSETSGSAAGSGTSRLPATEQMHGLHFNAGDWALMAHGYAWGVYSDQGGPRGDEKAFVASMAMLEGARPLGDTARLQLRAMLSLDPLMGDRGYPNLFATGETAGGEPLIDRQHPHDFFMELSARVDVDVAPGASLFLYGGPVAEPALGPSAFMHRGSARFNPEAPITHHWFDSTHITYGVLTAGVASQRFQLEASAFRGREPDEARWDIETPKLDSWSVRATWTPSPEWAAQISYGRLESPEVLHPGENEGRLTASIAYASGGLSVTGAYSAKNRLPGPTLDAWLLEANYDLNARNALFGRFENVENDELFTHDDPLHGVPFRASKFTLGYAHSIPLGGAFNLALGGSASLYAKPDALDAAYGDNPKSFTLFAKLSLGR